ncbi:hypothetical protein [uncultured Shewanella sp.]|uniref:hypothetical protein n=1 Tax=uncultured Shewanella sp. TaxID=173975 RepID=UPI0026276D44|nr:hypothetical protein [uncultured Shewanella sp.]
MFDTLKHIQQDETVSNERLCAILTFAKESQAGEEHRQRRKSAENKKTQARYINTVFIQDVEFKTNLTKNDKRKITCTLRPNVTSLNLP